MKIDNNDEDPQIIEALLMKDISLGWGVPRLVWALA